MEFLYVRSLIDEEFLLSINDEDSSLLARGGRGSCCSFSASLLSLLLPISSSGFRRGATWQGSCKDNHDVGSPVQLGFGYSTPSAVEESNGRSVLPRGAPTDRSTVAESDQASRQHCPTAAKT